jgi:hypothetical protein
MTDDHVPIEALSWMNDYATEPEVTFQRMLDIMIRQHHKIVEQNHYHRDVK